MGLDIAKRISDPVYGSIGLTSIEAQVIDTRVFQRLHNVKQLGLAHMVFPGADFSRFAHSIGVCHVTGRILESLQRVTEPGTVRDDDVRLYRLAGLLHDVGHYPYSHAMEQAIQDYYSNRLLRPDAQTGQEQTVDIHDNPLKLAEHEPVGKQIVQDDCEIRTILKDAGISPESVYRIFTRESTDIFTNLVSSDLDADRIDYLLRTAHHTGLPYGTVDLEYILSQIRLDAENMICIRPNAVRAAEHFLLSRFFSYLTVAYHKTVAGLELVLKDVISELLRLSVLRCNAQAVRDLISNGTWCTFDDSRVLEHIRTLQVNSRNNDLVQWKAQAILEREPPKLVGEIEYIDQRSEKARKDFAFKRKTLKGKIINYAQEFGIAPGLWYTWGKDIPLTKIGSHVPVSEGVASPEERDASEQTKDRERFEQAVRVQNGNHSESIMEIGHSLMNVLANYSLYVFRIYVLLPPGKESLKSTIASQLREDHPDIGWK